VDTVGNNKKVRAEYIRNQLQEDLAYEQMCIRELVDPLWESQLKHAENRAALAVV